MCLGALLAWLCRPPTDDLGHFTFMDGRVFSVRQLLNMADPEVVKMPIADLVEQLDSHCWECPAGHLLLTPYSTTATNIQATTSALLTQSCHIPS